MSWLKIRKSIGLIPVPILLLSALGGGAVLGAWILSLQDSSNYVIDTNEPLEFSVSYSGQTITGITEDTNYTDSSTLTSNNGDLNLNISWVEDSVDVGSDSCDNTGDISYIVKYDGSEIGNNQVHLLPSSSSKELVIERQIKSWACPQNHTIDVQVTGYSA